MGIFCSAAHIGDNVGKSFHGKQSGVKLAHLHFCPPPWIRRPFCRQDKLLVVLRRREHCASFAPFFEGFCDRKSRWGPESPA